MTICLTSLVGHVPWLSPTVTTGAIVDLSNVSPSAPFKNVTVSSTTQDVRLDDIVHVNFLGCYSEDVWMLSQSTNTGVRLPVHLHTTVGHMHGNSQPYLASSPSLWLWWSLLIIPSLSGGIGSCGHNFSLDLHVDYVLSVSCDHCPHCWCVHV